MGAADRWGIIDDSFSLAEAGSLPYAVALSTARFLRNDRHPVPWNSASDVSDRFHFLFLLQVNFFLCFFLQKLNRISSLVYGTDLYPAFRVSRLRPRLVPRRVSLSELAFSLFVCCSVRGFWVCRNT